MVKSIHIQNFRCFEDFQLDGLGRVNLIGGMNNSGKTILLEGIYLGTHLSPALLEYLKGVRYQKHKSSYLVPEVIWNDIFFGSQTNRTINIKTASRNKEERNLQMSLANNGRLFHSDGHYGHDLNFKIDNGKNELLYEINLLPQKEEDEEWKVTYSQFSKNEFPLDKIPFKGFIYSNIKYYSTSYPVDIYFNLAEAYSKFKLDNGKEQNLLLDAFSIIDASIIDIEILFLKRPMFYIRREGEPPMPIELFGDAMKKVAEIVLKLIECKDGILLIDEIENGIHYANQAKVWKLIFQLAKKFNVQVFATTHSREMAEAFNQIATREEFEEEARYIEMARHHKTRRLIATVMEMDILKHKLDHNKPFRGE